MAQQLGMRIVAEDLEDAGDWDLVRHTGCTVAQGYLIGKPMPGADIPAWLDDWPARHDQLLTGMTQ